MKDVFLTILRDRASSVAQYRQATDQLGRIIAAESGMFLQKTSQIVQTPLGSAQGAAVAHQPLLVPILRSGLALLFPFISIYPHASVGILGIRREEKTALPHLYYSNLPPFEKKAPLFLLDPMIATGGSATLAIKILKEAGADEAHIILFGIVASQEGLDHITSRYPKVRFHLVHVDPELNAQKMIVPGLGDFGDRFFG